MRMYDILYINQVQTKIDNSVGQEGIEQMKRNQWDNKKETEVVNEGQYILYACQLWENMCNLNK